MVITKHFAIHGKNYRSKLIKYILNPSKTKNLTLVSDFGMRNYLDFPSYKELVKMYNDRDLREDDDLTQEYVAKTILLSSFVEQF